MRKREELLNYLQNQTMVNLYDARTFIQYNFTPIADYVNQSIVRQELNVGNHYYMGVCINYEGLIPDIMQSQKQHFPTLLSKYKVLLYQGQFDLRDGVANNEAWFYTIPWPGEMGFAAAPQILWTPPNNSTSQQPVFGFVKSYSNLTHVVVAGAGHLVPYNQPEAALDMVVTWINGGAWNSRN